MMTTRTKAVVRVLAACALLTSAAAAAETKFWTQSEQADFEKATLHGLSLRNDGRLTLAPQSADLFDPSTPYLWSVAHDSKGNIYTGGGGSDNDSAKLFVIGADGKGRVLAQLPGVEIHAVAVDSADRVYAATSPDGKIYRVNADGKPQVLYDPHAKYIWALAFNRKGDLFAATGDQGEIHRVTRDGVGSVFFKTEETHARSLAFDGEDNLIVGTEPGGLILRVSPSGVGFVLYQAPKREITAVAVNARGEIYAAAVGNKTSSGISAAPAPAVPVPSPSPGAASAPTLNIGTQKPTPPPMGVAAPAIAGGSDVYRIDKEGAPRKVWSNASVLVYTIAFDDSGRPLIGTGNRGGVYRLDTDTLSTLLLDVPPTQVTGLCTSAGGKMYAVTGNIGKVYQIGPAQAGKGTLESDIFDAVGFSYWGRLSFHGSAQGLSFYTRSGNLNRPQNNWSAWTPVTMAGDGGRIASPAARFLQYKLEMTGASEVSSLDLAFLEKNIAPEVTEIEITPVNYRFPTQSLTLTPSQNLTLAPMGARKRTSNASNLDIGTSQTLNFAKGFIGARWLASDENGDSLTYSVEIRGVNETHWLPLKDKLREKYLSWDSATFPDGEYVLRVTASDEAGNPAGQGLSSRLVSDPFPIDNTPPRITDMTATAGANPVIHWKASDTASIISKAEYSVNGGDWMLVEPDGKLSDSLVEEYHVTLNRSSAGQIVVAIRVADDNDNQAVEKIVIP